MSLRRTARPVAPNSSTPVALAHLLASFVHAPCRALDGRNGAARSVLLLRACVRVHRAFFPRRRVVFGAKSAALLPILFCHFGTDRRGDWHGGAGAAGPHGINYTGESRTQCWYSTDLSRALRGVSLSAL